MLQPVAVAHKHLSDYASIVGRPLVDEIRERAERLKGKRVLHLSATAFGGGVSEILYTLVPLMIDVGLRCRVARDLRPRGVLQRDEGDAQRAPGQPSGSDRGAMGDLAALQRDQRARAVRGLGRVHRPRSAAGRDALARARQGAPLGVALPHRPLDARTPRRSSGCSPTSTRIRPPCSTCRSTCRTACNGSAHIVPPAIDPLAPKNMAFSPEDAVYICDQFGIDVDRPLLCQVSRFDPWKDPLGRDRRLPDRQGADARGTARAGRARWPPTIPRAGTTSTRPSHTPTAIPTSTSSTT